MLPVKVLFLNPSSLFLESKDFEDAIRLAISLGGDADTMGAITGSIAEAYYKNVPDHIKEEILKRLPEEFINVMEKFYKKFIMKNDDKFSDKTNLTNR